MLRLKTSQGGSNRSKTPSMITPKRTAEFLASCCKVEFDARVDVVAVAVAVALIGSESSDRETNSSHPPVN
jgi:hypothetical protein